MFAIESYLKNRKAKIAAWQAAGKVWVTQGDYSRYIRDYEIEYPYPVVRWGDIARLGGIALVILAFVGIVVLIASAPQPKRDANNPYGCETVVKKGDLIAVAKGDFDGSEGTVLQQNKNCDVDLRLTKSTNTFAICKAESPGYTCDKTKEIGTVLNVDRNGKIIKL